MCKKLEIDIGTVSDKVRKDITDKDRKLIYVVNTGQLKFIYRKKLQNTFTWCKKLNFENCNKIIIVKSKVEKRRAKRFIES